VYIVVHIPMRAIPTFGDDTSAWLEEMDHVVRQQGEIFVCPENFANCFITGDVVKMWYMNMGSEIKEITTTKVGCWDRFKKIFAEGEAQ
jgi:hypothetical protein